MSSCLILSGPSSSELEEWGHRKQLIAFLVWRSRAQTATMRQYVVATNVLVEQFSHAPWCGPLRRWLRFVHLGLKALACHSMGQWWPYGRMNEDMLCHLRGRWQ